MTACRTKGIVSEDDVYALVQRYGASTIFTLLQEVSQATEKDAAIDWRAIVKATSTGISNAREYQMLWRHLAYKDLLEKVEDGDEPLSDESDLEFELEVVPNISKEVSTEVDCCVKVLLSSSLAADCGPIVALNVEAPTTDPPNEQSSVIPSDKQHFMRYNRSINGASHYAQKQPSSAGLLNEGLDVHISSNSGFPAKKKRKLWTKEEDMELIAAVEKFGEGNWANILKGDFKHDRTASQLSQRWAIIRKRQTSSKQSTGSKARSEEMLAAQKAFSMALNMPMSGSLSSILSGGTQIPQTANPSSSMTGITSGAVDDSSATVPQPLKQNQQSLNNESSTQKAAPYSSSNARTTQKKPPAPSKPSICPNPLIKAAAFAAGGRIATPSTAASLFKAAQSKNAVHIRHGGGASLAGSPITAPTTVASAAAAAAAINPRFIHTSISSKKLCQVQPGSGKASSPCSTMQQPLSEPKAGGIASSGLLENTKKRRGLNSSAMDADELVVEDGRAELESQGDAQVDDDSTLQINNGNQVINGIYNSEVNGNNRVEDEEIQGKKMKREQSAEMKMESGDFKPEEKIGF